MKRIRGWLLSIFLLLGISLVVGLLFSQHQRLSGRLIYVKQLYGKNTGIYLLDLNAGRTERLTPPGNITWPVVSPVWSPQGDQIAFGCRIADRQELCLIDAEGWWQIPSWEWKPILIIDRSSLINGLCQELIEIASVSWDHTGQQVVMAGVCELQDNIFKHVICIVDLDGQADCWPVSQVSGEGLEPINSLYVASSPTDSRLLVAFDVKGEDENRLYLTDFDGHNSILIGSGSKPRWSPDGEKLVVIKMGPKIVMMDREGHNSQTLYESPENPFTASDHVPLLFPDSPATWSPNMRFIAFVGGGCCDAAGGDAIYLLNIKTREVQRITPLSDGALSEPDWTSW